MEEVKLSLAWVWECAVCKRQSFVRAVPVELTKEDRADMAESLGGEPGDYRTGEWEAKPDDVTCPYCLTEFLVELDDPPTEQS